MILQQIQLINKKYLDNKEVNYQDALNQVFMQKDMQNKVLNLAAILLLVIIIELKYL